MPGLKNTKEEISFCGFIAKYVEDFNNSDIWQPLTQHSRLETKKIEIKVTSSGTTEISIYGWQLDEKHGFCTSTVCHLSQITNIIHTT